MLSKDKLLIIVCLLALMVAPVGIGEAGAITPETRIRLEPSTLVVGPNETFVVQVVIEQATDLGAFQFDLAYDPSILQTTEVALDAFLESTGNSAIAVGPEINNAEGRTTFGAITFGNAAGPSGTGVLVTITCIAQKEGTTALRLQNVQLLDTTASAQRVTVQDGQIVVRGVGTPTPAAPVGAGPTSTPKAVDTPPPTAFVETIAPASPPAIPPLLSPSPTPLATVSVPAATSPSGWAMVGLILAALAVATLAVFILSRRPRG